MRTGTKTLGSIAVVLGLSLAAALLACGASDPKSLTTEAYTAMNQNDSSTAVAKFEEAIAKLDPSSKDYHQDHYKAAIGRCQALAKVDAKKCQEEFLKLASAIPEQVKDRDYKDVAGRLAGAKQFVQAIEVMEAGNQRFKGSPDMKEITELIISRSKEAGDVEAIKKLKSLGYL